MSGYKPMKQIMQMSNNQLVKNCRHGQQLQAAVGQFHQPIGIQRQVFLLRPLTLSREHHCISQACSPGEEARRTADGASRVLVSTVLTILCYTRAGMPTSLRKAAALSFRSQVKLESSRPKWPCRAVSR